MPLHARSDRVDELFHTLLREATESAGAQQNGPKRTQEYHSSRLLTSQYGAGPAPVVVDGTKAIYDIVPNNSVYSQPPPPRSSSAIVSDVDTEDGSDSHNHRHARKARANEYDVVGHISKTPYESVTSKLD